MQSPEAKKKAELQIYTQSKEISYEVQSISTEESTEESVADIIDQHWRLGYKIPEWRSKYPNKWTDVQQAQFIESVLLGLPLPFIYVARLGKNKSSYQKWELIDGYERIYALYNFRRNGFALNQMEILTDLEGFTFDDLEANRKTNFLHSNLGLLVLNSTMTDATKEYLFKRVNAQRLSNLK
jgi:hypothetical protein